ncbi:MAG TPA: hypothetical protein VFH29_10015, partial [Anaerolineales bacterium]|nr:hypothetical protein [Anaerolineales bacterium]
MKSILADIRKTDAYQRALSATRQRSRIGALRLPSAARLAFAAAFQQDLNCSILLLTDRDHHALVLWEELSFWTESRRLHCGEPNPLFYERSPWSATVRRERIDALTALASSRLDVASRPAQGPVILIASARALMT